MEIIPITSFHRAATLQRLGINEQANVQRQRIYLESVLAYLVRLADMEPPAARNETPLPGKAATA